MHPQSPHHPKDFDMLPTPPRPVQPQESHIHPEPTDPSMPYSGSVQAPPSPQFNTPPPGSVAEATEVVYDRNEQRGKAEELKNLLFTIALFILAPIFAIFMIVFVFQSYVVDGSSMEPTLQNGDRVFILKLPKTVASLKNSEFVPARNEVIVFKKPTNDGTQLIKRVIGLPGERVVVSEGKITVYNIDNPEGFDPDAGTNYVDNLEPISTNGDTIEMNVGEGELFVLGDNRGPGGSLDSHSGLGLVPVENIVGRLWIRYFPLSKFEVFATLPAIVESDDRILGALYS